MQSAKADFAWFQRRIHSLLDLRVDPRPRTGPTRGASAFSDADELPAIRS
jgi:hypothetical protein